MSKQSVTLNKKYFYNIELFRFIFAVSILLLHFSGLYLKPFTKEISEYSHMVTKFSLGYICVDFFFIISGFFWILNADKENSLFQFAKNKLLRLMPVIFFAMATLLIFSFFNILNFSFCHSIESLFLLSGLGITHNNVSQGLGNLHPIWFVSALFWGLIFFQYIFKNYQSKNINLFLAIFIVLAYGLITQENNGRLGGRIATTWFGIYNLGILRAICGIGIGYFIGKFYKHNIHFIETYIPSIKTKLILTVLQLSIFFTIFYNLFVRRKIYNNDIFFILLFVLLFLLLLCNKDYFSRLLNFKFFKLLGVSSYSIYIMHIPFMELGKTFLFNKIHINLLSESPKTYFYTLIFCCVIGGILTYKYIELPLSKKLKGYFKS